MRDAKISSIYVTKRNRELVGIVHASDVSELIKQNINSIDSIIVTDVPKVELDTPINELMEQLASSSVPLVVIKGNKLQGIIVRSAVLGALSGSEVDFNGFSTPSGTR